MIAASEEIGIPTAPWTLGDVAKAVAFIVVVLAGVFGGFLILRFYSPWGVSGPVALLGSAVAEGSMIVAAWFFGLRKYRLSWATLGFRSFDFVAGLILVCLIFFSFVVIIVLYSLVINYYNLAWLKPPPVLPESLTGVWRYVIPLGLASVVAPVVEETFFRGFVFATLKGRFGFWLASMGSAALFAAFHISVSVFIPIFVLGMLLAALYNRTRSIWPCITLHFIYNTLVLLVTYSVEVSRATL